MKKSASARAPALLAWTVMVSLLTGCGGPDRSADLPPVPPRNPARLIEDEPYSPEIDAANFVHRIDNPYFPLIPGTTRLYIGESDGEQETEKFVVTDRTKTILGISTTVVRDQVFVNGELAEDTFDWFAQDRFGNVWYFGESSRDIEGGKVVSTAGSWEAGVDGAQPGIVMLAEPEVDDAYRQEFYEGEAEDVAKIVALDETIDVPFGTFSSVLVTEDRNPLEPGILERKYYAPGVGVVSEELIEGAQGFLELVDVRKD
ncbi:MAG: hypothetical protein ACRDH9_10890 [Actinomycetota bacterium]